MFIQCSLAVALALIHICVCAPTQVRLTCLKREEEALRAEEERLAADRARHIRCAWALACMRSHACPCMAMPRPLTICCMRVCLDELTHLPCIECSCMLTCLHANIHACACARRLIKRLRDEESSRFAGSAPTLYGRYVLMGLLGKGGFSEVHRVRLARAKAGAGGTALGDALRRTMPARHSRAAPTCPPTPAYRTNPHGAPSFPKLRTTLLRQTRPAAQAFDLGGLSQVAVKVHQLNSAWSEAKKASYVRHAVREYSIHKALRCVCVCVWVCVCARETVFLPSGHRDARNVQPVTTPHLRHRHPNIVALMDIFEVDANTFATVLELCTGGDLETHLREHGVRRCAPPCTPSQMTLATPAALWGRTQSPACLRNISRNTQCSPLSPARSRCRSGRPRPSWRRCLPAWPTSTAAAPAAPCTRRAWGRAAAAAAGMRCRGSSTTT